MRSHTDPVAEKVLSDPRGLSVKAENQSKDRDPLYLFVCHLEWRNQHNLRAYEELLAALDDPNGDIRTVASRLLPPRSSPHPKHDAKDLEEEAW